MAHSIGKTIAELRKEKGWTQVELAEKLQVSDKAVSKWEKDDACPSVEFFPQLSELFGVTIDYLMTGKKVDVITLDDMDDHKRLMYLIRKDDVSNFERFAYHQKNGGLPKEAVLEILNNKSIRIFNLCTIKPEYLATIERRDSGYTPADRIYDYIDDFVKMACVAGNIGFLDYIEFRSFAIGDKTSQLKNNKSVRIYHRSYQHSYNPSTAYCIKKETLEFIFNNPDIPESIIDYVATYEKFDRKAFSYGSSVANYGQIVNSKFSYMSLDVAAQLYQTKRFDLLKKYICQLSDEIDDLKLFIDNCDRHPNLAKQGEYFTRDGYIVGKAVTFSKDFIYAIVFNNDRQWVDVFAEHNKRLAELNIIQNKDIYCPSEDEIEELFQQVAREKRIVAIKNDTSISDHERRCKLAKEDALSLEEAVLANDYDAFVLIDESKRKQLGVVYLSHKGVQDVRFYIYAVNVSDDLECLHIALKNILENYPERYDIQDVLLSAGAIIDGNIAFTNILKQNVLILNKQVSVDDGDVEVDESVTKQQLMENVEANKLQYVIVNATRQLEKKLKTHIMDQVDLSEKIDKALTLGLIDEFTCKLLHKLRMARNSIMHTGNKHHYTAEIVKMWVDAVYSIK